MCKINYVIATYNGKCKRKHQTPLPSNVLKCHLKKILSLNLTNISQITIMKAASPNYYDGYYDIAGLVASSAIPIVEIDCENFGYSEGQWLKAYEIYQNIFDYYLFIEDDYCVGMNDVDTFLIDVFYRKFNLNIGLLCSAVQGKSDNKKNEFPIHFEGCVFTNALTLAHTYNNSKWHGNPRQWLHKIENIDNSYTWIKIKKQYIGAYYQLSFSQIITLSGIKHEDYLNEKSVVNLNSNCTFPYWSDVQNKILFIHQGNIIHKKYTIQDIQDAPIVPIQLCDKT